MQQLKLESSLAWDRESSAFDAALYRDSRIANSKRFLSLKEDMTGNPILSLDSCSRIAFVVHHVLGYQIGQAATMAELREKEFRAQLRSAHVQLASFHFGPHSGSNKVIGESALA